MKITKEEREKIHLVIDVKNLGRHIHVLKTHLEKQSINPTPTRERNIKKLLDSMCQEYPTLEARIHKILGINYDVVKKYKI